MFRPLSSCIVVLLAAACASLAAAPLRVGGFVVAPLVLGDRDRPIRGALRDYLEREVVPAGVPLRWMPAMSVHEAVGGLRNGSLDVMLVASGDALREPGTRASTWTYLHSQPHLALRDDAPLRAVRSLDQLAGLEIAWIAGPAISGGLLRSGARWRRIEGANWQVHALRLVQTGAIDAAYFENGYSPRYYVQTMGLPMRVLRLPMPPRSFFMLYSAKADRDTIARFDRVAGAAFAGRRFRDFLEKYPTEGMAPRP
ncbi:hypothetical protein [Massilia sp. METH4]|uniref:hypothetical protein n=1 Tax=Massilia sp. METH4 TaxID=3123041 RepID=UPI0030CF6518